MESTTPEETTSSIKTDASGVLEKLSTSAKPVSEQPWQEWIEVGLDFVSKVPDEVGAFFADYKQPLITLLLVLSSIVTVYITLAVLDAIDDIPLLAPVLELVGLGYTGWFIYRYLLKASNRSELIAEFESLKALVMGKKSAED